jgi:cytochrome P450
MPRADFSPTDLTELDDPYPRLAALRHIAPVVRLESGFWAVSGYEAAMEVFRQRGAASGPIAQRYLASLPPGAARDEMSHRINFLDPPDHPRVRGLVSKAFTPRRVADLLPWIAATAEQLLDDLAGAHEIDLLARFAHQLPSLVISELLGVPGADRDQLTAWSDAVAPLLGVALSDEDRARALPASEAFHAYLGALLDERRRHPGDDLLSALLAAEEGGERLSRVELLSLAATLYSAGHRTTRDLFSNGLSVLLREPERYRCVASGAWPIAEVVAECLRFETPTLFVVRIPVEPVTVAGERIGPYEPILIYLAAANRDPATYDEPNAFRPRPGAPPALSFAYGSHYCLGASLARNEAETMLAALVRRWPRLTLRAPLRWHLRGPFRGLENLVVSPRP